MNLAEGVDLYQGNDFAAAAAVDFVFLKATEGATIADAAFLARWPRLAATGKVRGAYHYADLNNSPYADFNHFASAVGPVLAAGDLMVLDFEAGAHDTHTWAQRTAWKNSFLALAKQRWPRHRVGLYCNLEWWNGTDNNCGDFLWIADYGARGIPRVQHPWTFQQYSTSGGVDHDVFNGDIGQLRAWAGVPAPAPIPFPVQPPTEDGMPTFVTGEIKPGFAFDHDGTLVAADKATIILTPPADAGALQWADTYLSLGCDLGSAAVRVAVHNGQSWAVLPNVQLAAAADRWWLKLPVGAGKVSLSRVPTSAGDTADAVPVAWMIEAGTR